ncbi:universal stress protein, partial [Microbacterium caowuchunii]
MSETNPESAHLYRHIVVGVDSSDQSAAALHHACLLAEEVDARLTVVLVWSLPIGYDGVLASGTDIERNAETELATIVAQSVPERLKDRIRAVTRSGAPAPVLIDESEEADLLVIG